jgi:hypothetical protein
MLWKSSWRKPRFNSESLIISWFIYFSKMLMIGTLWSVEWDLCDSWI